ncbi:MAG: thioesterase family protein [Planctomycetota bacterium]
MQPPSVPDEPQFIARLRTRWSDEDNQAVLNNAVYMTLFEEARFAFAVATGGLAANRFPFLLAQTNVRFLRPGRGGVDVSVELSTVHLGTSSFRQAYRVRGPEGEVWAEAEAALVCYDPETGRSRPIEAQLRRALAGDTSQRA